MNLIDYGWNEFFEKKWEEAAGPYEGAELFPARIIADFGQILRVRSNEGELCINRPVNKPGNGHDMQMATGDWIGVERLPDGSTLLVKFVLQRKTKFSRAAAGAELKEQIVAANVDIVFLIQSLNRDFNMRRLERYLIAAWDSGAIPVVVLTKTDCCEDVADKLEKVYDTAPGIEVHAISCVTGEGLDELYKYFIPGKTVALLGSSGVGKSTLVNTLAGAELLKTQEIREDDSHGRHTTTHRELILLPRGGIILDTPGMRALSLWEAETGMDVMFGDVEELVTKCRFNDCKHGNEPGCAVREALRSQKLDVRRWESWLKLQKELRFLEGKKAGKQRLMEKQWGKQISKYQKSIGKYQY